MVVGSTNIAEGEVIQILGEISVYDDEDIAGIELGSEFIKIISKMPEYLEVVCRTKPPLNIKEVRIYLFIADGAVS